jgi:predicted transcriptional regulator
MQRLFERKQNCRYCDFHGRVKSTRDIKTVEWVPPGRSHKRHRNKEEMIASILEASKKTATKTGIMRTCYFSYELLQKYLNHAIRNRLLFYESESNRYRLTSKGVQYLDFFAQYRSTEIELLAKKKLISDILEQDEK